MSDDPTSVRALIAGYRACERPSAATEARIRQALADASRQRRRRPAPAPAPSRLGWVALAAAIVLLIAWRSALPWSMRQDPKDRGALSPFAAPTAPEAGTTTRAPPSPAPPPPSVTPPPAPIDAPARGEPARRPARPRPSDAAPTSTVLEEMALLRRAQAAMREGRPGEALTLLERHAGTFARGSLTEEREALQAMALCAAGEATRGATARAAFLRSYPGSTYAPRVVAACPDATRDESQDPR